MCVAFCSLVLLILIEDIIQRILMASICNLGTCPSPRCNIPLNQVHNMGKPSGMLWRNSWAWADNNAHCGDVNSARRLIYQQNYQVNSAAVERILCSKSLVPTVVCCNDMLIPCWLHVDFFLTQNAFSNRLSPLGFNLFSMLLPNLMHEFELGVWRAVFIHHLRILQSVDEKLLIELDPW